LEGAHRFLKRLWNFAFQYADKFLKHGNMLLKTQRASLLEWENGSGNLSQIRRELHQILQQARYDFERSQLNTVISACMKMLNLLYKLAEMPVREKELDFFNVLLAEGFNILLRLLSPIAPHITHYLWKKLAYEPWICDAKWPKVNRDVLKAVMQTIVIQINGKMRSKIEVQADLEKETLEKIVLEDEKVKSAIENKEIKKIIIVPGRIINIVI